MKKKTVSKCPVTRGDVDLDKYAKVDGLWRDLGLAAPARRALVDARILKISDLKKWSDEDLLQLHGMGPNAMKILKKVLRN